VLSCLPTRASLPRSWSRTLMRRTGSTRPSGTFGGLAGVRSVLQAPRTTRSRRSPLAYDVGPDMTRLLIPPRETCRSACTKLHHGSLETGTQTATINHRPHRRWPQIHDRSESAATTSSLEGRCSIHLSYERVSAASVSSKSFDDSSTSSWQRGRCAFGGSFATGLEHSGLPGHLHAVVAAPRNR
jgi:hypothetical protein